MRLRLTRDDPPLTGRSRDQHISATGTPPAAKIVKVPSRGVTWSGSTGRYLPTADRSVA